METPSASPWTPGGGAARAAWAGQAGERSLAAVPTRRVRDDERTLDDGGDGRRRTAACLGGRAGAVRRRAARCNLCGSRCNCTGWLAGLGSASPYGPSVAAAKAHQASASSTHRLCVAAPQADAMRAVHPAASEQRSGPTWGARPHRAASFTRTGKAAPVPPRSVHFHAPIMHGPPADMSALAARGAGPRPGRAAAFCAAVPPVPRRHLWEQGLFRLRRVQGGLRRAMAAAAADDHLML